LSNGLGKLPIRPLNLAFPRLGRAVAQHQMGEIEVEFMGRDIEAFRHEAHIAERAGIDDRLEAFAFPYPIPHWPRHAKNQAKSKG
jgi:hypothetical protein